MGSPKSRALLWTRHCGLLSARFLHRLRRAVIHCRRGEFRRAILDTDTRFIFEFQKGNDLILTAWDETGPSDDKIYVKTDAKRAWRVDLRGNRTAVSLEDGQTSLPMASEPSALVLEGATFAAAEIGLAFEQNGEARAVVISPDAPGRAPDFILEMPQQVHDFFEGIPTERERLWKGPKDNSAKVWLAKEDCGLRIRVEVEDDEHREPPEGAARNEGDCIEVAVSDQSGNGQRRFCFTHTECTGAVTRYDALVPYDEASGFTAKTLEDGIRFNLIVNDSDSDRRESAIGIATEAFLSDSMATVPTVRCAK